ncbi:MAG: hypothetical protein IPM36_03225 [Lewinellaceae bacterium]|nr:hypothetical protein [Lewinellaceae bacterium]
MKQFKPRFQFAEELGMSYATFRRRLIELGIEIPSGLLSPKTQKIVLDAFGCGDFQTIKNAEFQPD